MPSLSQTIATLHQRTTEGQLSFLGSAFAFRRGGVFLTAAHCVTALEADEMILAHPLLNSGGPTPVISIRPHPSVDVAVVKVSGDTTRLSPFYILSTGHSAGSDVGAWGFPEDSSPEGGLVPTPRFFRGNLQRLFSHHSPLGYTYQAGELSFGAPGGLSGGPVFSMPEAMHLIGVVAENFESTIYLRSIYEAEEDGRVTSERIHDVINYGLFVELAPLARWLDQEAGRELG